jgi:hypothetical protein
MFLRSKFRALIPALSCKAVLILTLLGLSVSLAQATPIAIPNASFENPTTPTGGDGAPVPGWVFNSPSGNLYGTSLIVNSFKSEGAASGSNYAFLLNDGVGTTDTITSAAALGTVAPNTIYTLTVAIGNVAGSDSVSNHSPGTVSFSLLANGVAFATDTILNGTVPDGTFEDFSLTYQTGSGSLVGKNLEIQLASLPPSGLGAGPAFDNVTLDASPLAVPEPQTWALMVTGVLALCSLARRTALRPITSVAVRLILAIIVIASAPLAKATPITVPNGSFETPSSPTSSSTNPNLISGWVFNVKGGSVYGTMAISSNFNTAGASSGNDAVFINNDAVSVTDTISSAASLATIAPNTQYTLTLAIGNVKQSDSSLYGAPGNLSFSLLANGNVIATQRVNNGTVANGTFQDFTLTYDSPISGTAIGENLTIQLATLPQSGSAYKGAFDNVTLDEVSLDPPVVPEPQTWALLAAGMLILGWRVHRTSKRAFEPAPVRSVTR